MIDVEARSLDVVEYHGSSRLQLIKGLCDCPLAVSPEPQIAEPLP